MRAKLLSLVVACAALPGLLICGVAWAQKSGGVLRIPLGTSIASVSIHEESTIVVLGPMMGVFNNLVMFDQHVPQNTLSSIVSDLASSWSWSEDGKELTFKLRDGVKWHDGKPFNAADVKCTWDLITGKSTEKLLFNPRKSWYRNLEEVKPNESVKVVRNPDYWKPGRPYLDAIEYPMITNPATAVLTFASGKLDRTGQGYMSIPLMKQLKEQAPNAECAVVSWNIPRQLLVNRSKPPFDNPELRRAIALTLDRRAFIDILGDGQGEIGGAMMPPPAGSWGMPPEILQTLPGYGSDVVNNRP